MGWDDNGLPTERRVQNYYGVRGDASLHHVEGYQPPHRGQRRQERQGRRPAADQPARTSSSCATSSPSRTRRPSRRSSGRPGSRSTGTSTTAPSTTARGRPRRRRSCATCAAARPTRPRRRASGTSRSRPPWPRPSSRRATTPAPSTASPSTARPAATRWCTSRPPAPSCSRPCVALIAHPDDERYAGAVRDHGHLTAVRRRGAGRWPTTLAEPDKGAGIAMCCTFGDLTDVQWWRELQLPTRSVIQPRRPDLRRETPDWITTEPGRRAVRRDGRQDDVLRARRGGRRAAGVRRPRRRARRPPSARRTSTRRATSPLEIVTSRQWYIRNGGRDEAICASSCIAARRGAGLPPRVHADPLRELGRRPQRRLADQPAAVLRRADPRLVPRRRRRARSTTTTRSCRPRTPCRSTRRPRRRPATTRPSATSPAGSRRPRRHGHLGHVLADARRSPAAGETDPELFAAIFPMDRAPAGPRHHPDLAVLHRGPRALEYDSLPWRHATLSGWILDPDRKKMSKSKGNAITPLDMLQEHGSDGVRYWAASARLGTDAALDTGADEGRPPPGHQGAQRQQVRAVVRRRSARRSTPRASPRSSPSRSTGHAGQPGRGGRHGDRGYEALDYTRALEVTESFFWTFCDDYLELVKDRAYGSARRGDARTRRGVGARGPARSRSTS